MKKNAAAFSPRGVTQRLRKCDVDRVWLCLHAMLSDNFVDGREQTSIFGPALMQIHSP